MGLFFHYLDDRAVRQHMLDRWTEELEQLKASYPRSAWPYGRLLTDEGWKVLDEIMPRALADHDDDWLEARMSNGALWLPKLERRKRNGGYSSVDYDKADAVRRLAMGEFNTAYVRGLGSSLVERGVDRCTIYRAGEAAEPRRYCTDLEETTVPVQQILDDHRAYFFSPGRKANSIPSGPNCHHSIRE